MIIIYHCNNSHLFLLFIYISTFVFTLLIYYHYYLFNIYYILATKLHISFCKTNQGLRFIWEKTF